MKRIVSVFLLFIAASGYADDYTWTGNAGDNRWDNSGNWSGGPSFPGVNTTNDTASIPGNTTPLLTASVEIATLTLTGGNTVFVNGAHTLTVHTSIGGSVGFGGGAAITLGSPDSPNATVTLGGRTTITVTGTGALTINSRVDGNHDLALVFANGFDTANANASFGPNIDNLSITSLNRANEAILPSIDIDGDLTINVSKTHKGPDEVDVKQADGANVSVGGNLTVSAGTYGLADQSVEVRGNSGVDGGGEIKVTDTATISATRDFTIATLTVGDVKGNATFRVGRVFRPGAFEPGNNLDTTDTDSTVIFHDTATNSIDSDPLITSKVFPYNFHNLTINDPGDTVFAHGDLNVYGELSMIAGTLNLRNHTHHIWGDWDSSNTGFTLVPAGSEVTFRGNSNATITTKGIGSQSLNKLQIRKDNNVTVTLASSLELKNHFTLRSGYFSVGTGHAIQIGGNWTDAPGRENAGFRHRNGRVTFAGNDSTFHYNYTISPYFHDLVVRDSELTLRFDSSDLVIGNNLTIHGATANKNASMLAERNITVNGDVLISADAANASLTTEPATGSGGTALFTANAATKSVTLQQTGTHEAKIDFTNQNFQIGTLNNGGEIRLSGSQATQGFPTAAAKKNYGLITYYGNVTEESRIRHNEFWNLTIDASGRSILMHNDITVWGRSDPNGNKTLTNDPGPVSHTDLNGLRILNGTLNAESGGSQYDIKLHGMIYVSNSGSYNWGTTANIGSGGATVEFKGPYPVYIGGDITFFRFLVNSGADAGAPVAPGEPVDSTMNGKHFYFQEGKTITIADHTDAKFIVVGDDVSPDDGVPDESWITLHSGASGTRWMISKPHSVNVTMKYVYVQDSNATPNEIRSPAKVWTNNCINWVGGVPYIGLSSTRDQLNNFTGTIAMMNNSLYQPNGRIDRILVEVSTPINSDFSGFEVEVEGYEVLGFDSGSDAMDHETLNSQQFWIILKEGNALDTGTTPSWRLVRNTTLRSTSGTEQVSMIPLKDKEIPYDGAPPLVGYTLAVVDSDRKEVFVHFSEPVVNTADGEEITRANFNTTVGGGVFSITRVSPKPTPVNNGMQEVVLKLDSKITTTNDVTGNARSLTFSDIRDIPTPKSTHDLDEGDRSDTASSLPSFSTSHRISDIALGIVGNGIVQPKSARGEQQTSINSFDGTEALWAGDIELEAHRATGQTFTPVIYWRNAREIDQSYKNNGLWLPYFEEIANNGNRPFFGLVPRPLSTGPSSRDMRNVTGNRFEYEWDSTDENIVNGSDLDFFFRIDGSSTTNHLYAARCEDDTASNWYRRIRPWSIKIRNTINQAGGVSIQNNIINPKNNEKTTLQYQLSSRGTVTIQVFDLSGNTVEVLQRGRQSPGSYTVSWDGRNHAGNVVARGIYFIRFVGPDNIDQIRKVLVVK